MISFTSTKTRPPGRQAKMSKNIKKNNHNKSGARARLFSSLPIFAGGKTMKIYVKIMTNYNKNQSILKTKKLYCFRKGLTFRDFRSSIQILSENIKSASSIFRHPRVTI